MLLWLPYSRMARVSFWLKESSTVETVPSWCWFLRGPPAFVWSKSAFGSSWFEESSARSTMLVLTGSMSSHEVKDCPDSSRGELSDALCSRLGCFRWCRHCRVFDPSKNFHVACRKLKFSVTSGMFGTKDWPAHSSRASWRESSTRSRPSSRQLKEIEMRLAGMRLLCGWLT